MELLVVEVLSSLLSVSWSPTSSGSTLMGFTTPDPPPGSIPQAVKRTRDNLALIPLVGSLVRLEGGMNRPIKIQLNTKLNLPAALPLCERGTTAPVGEISSQFKIYPAKFRWSKFLSFLQGSRSQIDS